MGLERQHIAQQMLLGRVRCLHVAAALVKATRKIWGAQAHYLQNVAVDADREPLAAKYLQALTHLEESPPSEFNFDYKNYGLARLQAVSAAKDVPSVLPFMAFCIAKEDITMVDCLSVVQENLNQRR